MFALFCDEIRQEINGKYIALGCYGSAMVVPQWPYSGQISAFIHYKPKRTKFSLSVRFKLANGVLLGGGDLQLELPELLDFIQVPTPAVAFSLTSEEVISLEVSEPGEDACVAAKIQIKLGETKSIFKISDQS